jgi:dCTP deaminase
MLKIKNDTQFRFLTDTEIEELINKGELIIEPIISRKYQIQSVGIDIRLDTRIRIFRPARTGIISVEEEIIEEEYYEIMEQKVEYHEKEQQLHIEPIIIHPGTFILAQSFEYICLPKNIMGFVDGRSSLARRGIIVHATAGSIEPDFRGHITLELGNIGELPVKLYPLMRVATIHFARVNEPKRPYKGQFQFQVMLKPPKPDEDLLLLLGKKSFKQLSRIT